MSRIRFSQCLIAVTLMLVVALAVQVTAFSTGSIGLQARQWQLVGLAGEELFDLDIDPVQSMRLYATTRAGIYRSTNGGYTWNLIRPGYSSESVVDPQNGDIVYTCPGVCKTTDGGGDWQCYQDGITDTNPASIAIAALNPELVFVGSF